jgi:uncharacterized repeat protein (TIGR03803 family)
MLAACVSITTGCSHSINPSALPNAQLANALSSPSVASYKSLYSFKGYPSDGAAPVASLIALNATLYGTTSGGGANACGNSDPGCGTVFDVSTSGREDILYDFGKSSTDGAEPNANLTDVSGRLYGTTVYGGTHGYGTVFKITTAGKESMLYSFKGKPDGEYPNPLVNVRGKLYGTTENGGSSSGCRNVYGNPGCGTVFEVDPSTGSERVLYSFKDGKDGAEPLDALIVLNGSLYGTTSFGGSACNYKGACGTVFSVTTAGQERVLHSFGKGRDGENPVADLVALNGTLYGTTPQGGRVGEGTVFKITTSGQEAVLYSFTGGISGHFSDGVAPHAALTSLRGILYGTTAYGGKECSTGGGCGTVFSVTTAGEEHVIHSFGKGTDGANPFAGLLAIKNTLYSTTVYGGSCGRYGGCGTVFSISP